MERVAVGLAESDDPAQRLDEDQHQRRRPEMVRHLVVTNFRQRQQIASTGRLLRLRIQRPAGALRRPSVAAASRCAGLRW